MNSLRISISSDFQLLLSEFDRLQRENTGLKLDYTELEETHQRFSKVSLLVAANKEIHKLNNDVTILKKQVIHYKELATAKVAESNLTTTSVLTPLEKDILSYESEEEVDVIEMDIEGDIYFISDDASKIIYERVKADDDYDIGVEMGYISMLGEIIWS
jgi:hypothetical protein